MVCQLILSRVSLKACSKAAAEAIHKHNNGEKNLTLQKSIIISQLNSNQNGKFN